MSITCQRGQLALEILQAVQGRDDNSASVVLAATNTLLRLAKNPAIVTLVTKAFVDMLAKQSESNVQLVLLGRLTDIRKHHRKIFEKHVKHLMSRIGAHSTDSFIEKVLELCLSSMGVGNVDHVLKVFNT